MHAGGDRAHDRSPRLDRLSEWSALRVAQEELAPLGTAAPAFEGAAIEQRPAIVVVVDLASEDDAWTRGVLKKSSGIV
jgi:hypothetical protein